jgi:hypothetical protein
MRMWIRNTRKSEAEIRGQRSEVRGQRSEVSVADGDQNAN